MPSGMSADQVAAAIFSGLKAKQIDVTKGTGILIPYNWKFVGKDLATLESYAPVMAELLKINHCGVFNKLVLRDGVVKISKVVPITNCDTDALALKQLLMDIGKKKNNCTTGLRTPVWLQQLVDLMTGFCEAEGDDHDEGDMQMVQVVGTKPSSSTDLVPKQLAAAVPRGWRRVPHTRVLLAKVSEESASAMSAEEVVPGSRTLLTF